MKYFFQNSKGELKELPFREILIKKLSEDFKDVKNVHIKSDRFGDASASWVDIELVKKEKIITLNFVFDDDGIKMNTIDVFVTPIKTIVDEENTEKLT